MGWIKKTSINASVLVASILVTLLVLEGVLHMLHYRFKFLPPLEPQGYVSYDKELGYDIMPNFPPTTHDFYDLSYTVSSNELGCFDESYQGETPYIYITGDSFTWGWAPLEDKWGKQIQTLIGERTVTCGVNGYGTRQQLIKAIRDLSRLPPPSLIVVGYLEGNDPEDDSLFPNYSVYNGYRIPNHNTCASLPCTVSPPTLALVQKVKFFLGAHSVLYNMLKRSFNVEAFVRGAALALLPDKWLGGTLHLPGPEGASPASAMPSHFDNILAFEKLAQDHNTKVLFVLLPGDNEQVIELLSQNNVPYLDLTPLFPEDQTAFRWPFNGHWNSVGNRFAGLLVSKYIVEQKLIVVPDAPRTLQDISAKLTEEFSQ